MAEPSRHRARRCIIHLDIDAFYAQVEHVRLGIPREQPLAVQQWTGLLAVNYAARPYGVKRGMTGADAKKVCPSIIIADVETTGGPGAAGAGASPDREHMKVDLERYREASRLLFSVLERDAALVVEKAGLDEAYVDCTDACHDELQRAGGCPPELPSGTVVAGDSAEQSADADPGGRVAVVEPLLRAGCVVAARLREAILCELDFTSSAGIACNKMLAKQASALNKPACQTVVPEAAAEPMLRDIKLRDVRGLGGKLGDRVEDLLAEASGMPSGEASAVVRGPGRRVSPWTAGDVLTLLPLPTLIARLGEPSAHYVLERCTGVGDDKVEPSGPPKSLMEMKSFFLKDRSVVHKWLRTLSENLSARVAADTARHQRRPRTLTLVFSRPREPMRSKSGAWPASTRAREGGAESERVRAAALALFEAANALPLTRLALQASNFVADESGSGSIRRFLQPGAPLRQPAAAPAEAGAAAPAAAAAVVARSPRVLARRAQAALGPAHPQPSSLSQGMAQQQQQQREQRRELGTGAKRTRPAPAGPLAQYLVGAAPAKRATPAEVPATAAHAAGSGVGEWECKLCTFHNGACARACDACGTRRGATVPEVAQVEAFKRHVVDPRARV